MLHLEEAVGPLVSTGRAQPINTVSFNGEAGVVMVGGTMIYMSRIAHIRELH